MAQYVVKPGAVITPGIIANAELGDTVRVYYNATERPDWGAFVQAFSAAFVRGAEVWFIPRNARTDRGTP